MSLVTHQGHGSRDEPKLLKNDDLKLDFLFLHSIKLFDGLQNDKIYKKDTS